MKKPRLLDLFCCAGGCSAGYHRAGFEVVGIDNEDQPHYPFEFHRADALEFLTQHGRDFDAIHASPPCQKYSICSRLPNTKKDHPDLVEATRNALLSTNKPYIIENVPGAPLLRGSIMLCGLMFGLGVLRHRWFESNMLLFSPPHPSHKGKKIGQDGLCCVAGHGGQGIGWSSSGTYRQIPKDHRTASAWRKAMGIDWMPQIKLAQAIPPAYTQFLGNQLLHILRSH